MKATEGGGEKGGTPVGPKDRTDKGNSLTEDTPRDAVTNALRLHLHNFVYKTFNIKMEAQDHPRDHPGRKQIRGHFASLQFRDIERP